MNMDVPLANQIGDFGDPLTIVIISGVGTALVIIIALIVVFVTSRRK